MNKNLAFWGMTISTFVYLILSTILAYQKKELSKQNEILTERIKYDSMQIQQLYRALEHRGNPYDTIGIPKSEIDSINELTN